MLSQSGAQLLGHIGHRRKVSHAIMINPAPQLLGAHLRFARLNADSDKPGREIPLRQAGKRGKGAGHGPVMGRMRKRRNPFASLFRSFRAGGETAREPAVAADGARQQ